MTGLTTGKLGKRTAPPFEGDVPNRSGRKRRKDRAAAKRGRRANVARLLAEKRR